MNGRAVAHAIKTSLRGIGLSSLVMMDLGSDWDIHYVL
jgi:hypothetical protein